MTDDDLVSLYRNVSREEPPPHLDTAILRRVRREAWMVRNRPVIIAVAACLLVSTYFAAPHRAPQPQPPGGAAISLFGIDDGRERFIAIDARPARPGMNTRPTTQQ